MPFIPPRNIILNTHFPPRLAASAAGPNIVELPASATLKIALTAQDGGKGKRPHQAFLTLQDPASGLEESFAFAVSDNGKAKLDLVCAAFLFSEGQG